MVKISWLLALLVLVSPAAMAAPSAEAAKSFVESLAKWSLSPMGKVKAPVSWETVSQHRHEFSDEFAELMEWVSTPHPDSQGRDWHYGLDPIWQVQGSSVTSVKIGSPKAEGDLQLVVVDYISPSAISPSRPSTRYHNVWVVGEEDGKPVLTDVRYHIKYPAQTSDGTVLADMKKAKASYQAP